VPFGAMPMCHGAGGLPAQYLFGGRTGLTPISFAAVALVRASGVASHATALFTISRFQVAARISPVIHPSARPSAGLTAGVTRRHADHPPTKTAAISATIENTSLN